MDGRGDGPADGGLAEVVRHELMLLDPSVRRSPEHVASLLHPDFVEVGASGRAWDARSVLAALQDEADDEAVARAADVVAVRLSDDVVLVTYTSHRAGRATLRSSVWLRIGSAWRLRYHQGTATTS